MHKVLVSRGTDVSDWFEISPVGFRAVLVQDVEVDFEDGVRQIWSTMPGQVIELLPRDREPNSITGTAINVFHVVSPGWSSAEDVDEDFHSVRGNIFIPPPGGDDAA